MVTTLFALALLFVGASVATAHHADNHDRGNGKGAPGGNGSGIGIVVGSGNGIGNGSGSGSGIGGDGGSSDRATSAAKGMVHRTTQLAESPPPQEVLEPVTVGLEEEDGPRIQEGRISEPPDADPPTTNITLEEDDSPPRPEVERQIVVPVLSLGQIGFTYWVDSDWIHVLADPVDDDEAGTGVTYRWVWGDGHTTHGEAFESHRLIDGVEQTIITLTRYDAHGRPTHEGTAWVDLTYYRFFGQSETSQGSTAEKLPRTVLALEKEPRPPSGNTPNELGALIESAPAPAVLLLVGLMFLWGLVRRR